MSPTRRPVCVTHGTPMVAFAFAVCSLGLGQVFPPLVTADQVRALPPAAAKAGRFVALRGVVTVSPRPHDYFYLQDNTGGVRVEWDRCDRELKPGDAVAVEGVAAPGAFLPLVKAARVVVTPGDRDRLPAPERFNLTGDEAHYLDGQWVVAEAVLQRAWAADAAWLKADLARGRGGAVAYIPRPLASEVARAAALRGAVVRVRGVWEWGPGGADPPHLLVSDVGELKEVAAAAAPDKLPRTTARALGEFRPDPIAARLPVRITGVVTLDQPHRQLFLHDATGAVQVAYTNRADVRAGQRVEVVGFPRLGTDPVRLDNADVRVLDPEPGPLPPPHPGTVAEAVAGKLDGRVVALAGTVVDTGSQAGWPTANLLLDGVTFAAVFLNPDAAVEPGSRVEVVGVATRQQFERFRPHTFAVIVRRGDHRVLEGPPAPPQPPAPAAYWTGARVGVAGAGVAAFCLIGGAGATVLRLQVRRAAALAGRERAERAKLEGQLRLAARLEAAGRLAGSVAHDFNNLLTVINGSTALLEGEIGGANHPDRTGKLATAIRRAGEEAAALTRQLLVFSRHGAVAPYPLDLNRVVLDTADLLERLIGDRVAVRLVAAPGLPPVVAEPGQLAQVLLNLAVNAADAMPGGGTFTITTGAPEPDWVRLTATDTGTGMTDEAKAHAFEAGFTTKAAGKGTGLGLATVYGIVRGFGGRVRFASEPGRGTAFEIDLPVAPGAAPAPRALPEHPTAEVARDATRPAPALAAPPAVVLLVEDEEAVCALLRHVLEAAGHTVLAAGEPAAALQLLARHPGRLDLLLTDVVLPGLSGRQLADRVRAARPDVRVLFMSGYTAEEVREHGVSEEQVEFLHKPFLPRDLVEQVARVLAPPGTARTREVKPP